MPTIRELREKYRKINAQNEYVNYFDRLKEHRKAESEIHAAKIAEATERGKKKAEDFMVDVTDVNNVSHTASLKKFRDRFNSSKKLVVDFYVQNETSNVPPLIAESIENIDEAEAQAAKDLEEFVKRITDFDHIEHEGCVALLKKLNANPSEVKNYFIEQSYISKGLSRTSVRDLRYEASVVAGYEPANEYEKAALVSLADFFRERHNAIGYQGDTADYMQFQKENIKISGNPAFIPVKYKLK